MNHAEEEPAFEKSSGNVYADLGVPDAEEMLVKARLVSRIAEVMTKRKLTQVEAAKILEMPQPKISNMLRGHFRGISQTKMIECLTRLGLDVEIVVKKEEHSGETGHISVVFS